MTHNQDFISQRKATDRLMSAFHHTHTHTHTRARKEGERDRERGTFRILYEYETFRKVLIVFYPNKQRKAERQD